jgi:hypothetical protein
MANDPNNMEQMVDELTEEQLHMVAQTSINWMSGQEQTVDEDGFVIGGSGELSQEIRNYSKLQQECWNKFVSNPQINSHVRDFMGNLTGNGFAVESPIHDISEYFDEIWDDPRNALYVRMGQFVARSEIEGELFLSLTVHPDGFVEIDFIDPSLITGGSKDNSGIFFHPNKSAFPLFYRFEPTEGAEMYLPSINLAYFPEMIPEAEKMLKKQSKKGFYNKSTSRKYAPLKGLCTFVIAWDRGFLTTRNVSHVKTTLVWLNHYEDLKRWEIDHKKSSGSYLWVAKINDSKAYRTWLKLTKEEKAETGLFSKKTPGGTIVLPPGIDLECRNPNLSSISNQDTDIMHMVTAGLNRTEDMVNGTTMGGTKAGITTNRGPQSDRIQDQKAYFSRFLRYEFCRGMFTLAEKVGRLKPKYNVHKAVSFKDKEPVFKTVPMPHYKLVDFEFPVSEISDIESKARALLGVKHGSVSESLGIPKEDIATKLGFGSYAKKRLMFSTEEDTYPPTPLQIQIDAAEESAGSQEPQNVPNPSNQSVDGNEDASP